MDTKMKDAKTMGMSAVRHTTRLVPSLKIWKARREAFEKMEKINRQWNVESWLHQKRTGVYTRLLTEALFAKSERLPAETGSGGQTVEKNKGAIVYAAYLHDVGETAELPDSTSTYTSMDMDMLISHHTIGCGEIIDSYFDREDTLYYRTLGEVCRHHHERWDGRGYPDVLSGTEIPLSARIVAVADAYDRVSGRQLNRKPYSHERAAKAIRAGKGKLFDPEIVALFDEIEEQFYDSGKALSKGYGIRQLV